MRFTRTAVLGLLTLGLSMTPTSAQVEEIAGDLNKMATDGYVQVVFHGAGFVETGSGSTFSGAVIAPDGLESPLSLLPDGRPQLHVTVFTTDWLGDMQGHHFSTTGGGHGGIDQPLTSAIAPSSTAYEFTLPAGFGGAGAWVTVWAAVDGYPEACAALPIESTCDGGALGFYNVLKHAIANDVLDVVPGTTFLP